MHPLLARLLLATGRRVGCLMSIRKEFIRPDRIEIPGYAARTKVRWNKRHLSHMTQVIPRTPEIDAILETLGRVGSDYGDSSIWLFPSTSAESGHMEEERSAAVALRKHSGVRFTCHQLRHNVATAAEEFGYGKSEIRELLGQGEQTVTDRYIDERVKRQRRQLIEIHEKQKVRLAEDAWNSRDPARVALAHTVDSRWRNRSEFLQGRAAIQDFLTRKWHRELDYRLIKEIWGCRANRIAVRFAYEWHDDSGLWYRSYGNENWEFDEHGLMRVRLASINDALIRESERKYHWPLGRRPDDHPSLSELGF
jgi:hypothetical protein